MTPEAVILAARERWPDAHHVELYDTQPEWATDIIPFEGVGVAAETEDTVHWTTAPTLAKLLERVKEVLNTDARHLRS